MVMSGQPRVTKQRSNYKIPRRTFFAVTLFSGREAMRATEEYFARTINLVKVQSTSYEKYNDTITAKSLRRMAVSVRQLAENDTLDIYDPEALRAETESLWLTGIAVLDENGKSLCEYTDGNISYAQFAESLRENAALNVLQNPQKTYLKRILLQDGTAVDVATHRAAAGDSVLLAYRVTPPEFVEGTALSIQSVLDGYPQNVSGTIFIVQDNKVIAANDPSLIGLYTTNSPLVQGIRKAGAPDTLTHTHDWANSGCYFGMYSNGRNFDLYLYINEKSVFRNASSPERGSFFVSAGQRLRVISPARHSKLSRAAKKPPHKKCSGFAGCHITASAQR